MTEYNHKNGSAYAIGDCIGAIGKHGTLTVTGKIVDAGVSSGGPYVKFVLDERWGFGDAPFIMDLDLIEGIHD